MAPKFTYKFSRRHYLFRDTYLSFKGNSESPRTFKPNSLFSVIPVSLIYIYIFFSFHSIFTDSFPVDCRSWSESIKKISWCTLRDKTTFQTFHPLSLQGYIYFFLFRILSVSIEPFCIRDTCGEDRTSVTSLVWYLSLAVSI